MQTKICSRCRNEYPATEEYFHKQKKGKYGVTSRCKKCVSETWHNHERQEVVERGEETSPFFKVCKGCGNSYPATEEFFRPDSHYKNGLRARCRECESTYSKNYKESNPEKVKQWARDFIEQDPERYRKYRRDYHARKKNDPQYRLSRAVGARMHLSLKESKGGNHWEDLVGYTVDDLRKHLELQFTDEMSWENYGSYWHVDHIRPVSDFKFTSPKDKEFLECWSLWNLQPLEGPENMSKGDRCDEPPLPLL